MPQYRRRFRRKINELEESIEELGDITIINYELSIDLFQKYSEKKYNKIKENTEKIIKQSKDIENMCVTLLAMEQPVANDLRFVENSIKIANHLKRIGKLSVDIARIANEIKVNEIPQKPLESMNHMANEVRNMLNRSIRSFITENAEEAAELEEDDDVVDDLFDDFLVTVTEAMKNNTESIDTLVPFLLIARYLERIADRSESIGGRVLIMQKYQTE